ncbi:MAG TPA: hypothetical protein VIF82_00035 [Burkholderiaceae bacterium]|jgi:hypothetical protein
MKKGTIGTLISETQYGNESSQKMELPAQSSTCLSSDSVAAICAELARLNTNTIRYLACAEFLIHQRIDEVISALNLSAANASSSGHDESLEDLMARISRLMNSAHQTKESFSKAAEQQAILTSDALNILIENLKRGKSSY